jgi:hypothetical protein
VLALVLALVLAMWPRALRGCLLRAAAPAVVALWLAAAPAQAGPLELARLDVQNTEQGVLVDFDTRFELPPGVEEALKKGVALHFVAEATVYRERWYWRDRQVAKAQRTWRIVYQPLTLSYRVSLLGGLGQSFPSLGEALRAVQRASQWRIADGLSPDDDRRFYVEFSYQLDREALPRPLQLGVGSLPEWDLQVARTVPLKLR